MKDNLNSPCRRCHHRRVCIAAAAAAAASLPSPPWLGSLRSPCRRRGCVAAIAAAVAASLPSLPPWLRRCRRCRRRCVAAVAAAVAASLCLGSLRSSCRRRVCVTAVAAAAAAAAAVSASPPPCLRRCCRHRGWVCCGRRVAAVVLGAVEEDLRVAMRGRSLVRYDAYNELSGKQSVSIALLDDQRSGVVLSCIHHRDQARVYAKQVTDGHGELELSPEEAEAVRIALSLSAGTGEAAEHPHMIQRGTVRTVHDPVLGDIELPGPPAR